MLAIQAVPSTDTSRECKIGCPCREYDKLVCAVAYQLTKDQERACVLAAKTFQKAFEARDELRKLEHPKAWLLTTLRQSYQESRAAIA